MTTGCTRIAMLGLVLGTGLLASAQSLPLRPPEPTGQYAVGRTTYSWLDASRANRPVRVDVWYPASFVTGETGPYFPDLAALAMNPVTGPTIANYFGSNLQRLIDRSISSNVYDSSPIAQGQKPFPVLLFSHGLGQSPFTYAIQLEELASHGYVVAAPSHIGDALVVSLPGGAVPFDTPFWAKYPAGEPSLISTYEAHHRFSAEDLVFTLNQVTVLSRDAKSPFNGMLDLDRVGAFGHSSGGRSAVGACMLDSRIQACLNEDGGLHRQDWLSTTPVFSGTFAILDWFDPGLDAEDYAGLRTTPSNYARQVLRPLETDLKTWRQPERGSYRLTLLKSGMAHTAFTDMRWLTATSDASGARFLNYLAQIRNVTRAFFDQTLYGRSSPLLSCIPNESDLLVQCYKPERPIENRD